MRYSLACMAVVGAMATMTAFGHEYTQGPIEIGHPWARASAPMAQAGAAFMTLTNRSAEDDRLIRAEADLSETVELHTHLMDGGIMRMREVEAIAIPAGGTTDLKPGGLHVMFLGLKQPLTEGKSFPLTLVFEKAGTIEVAVSVAPIGAPGPAASHSHH